MHTPWIRSTLTLILLTNLLLPAAADATPAFEGRWTINEDESDDPHDQLKGLKMVKSRPPTASTGTGGREDAQRARAYTQQALVKERHLLFSEADVGELSRILNATSVNIVPADSGFQFSYEDGFKRQLSPRPGGAVYTAKGDEFLPDELGRSMVYWRSSVLVIETLLAPRGTMTEEVSLQSAKHRLKIHTVLKNPDWDFDADIIRIFEVVSQ